MLHCTFFLVFLLVINSLSIKYTSQWDEAEELPHWMLQAKKKKKKERKYCKMYEDNNVRARTGMYKASSCAHVYLPNTLKHLQMWWLLSVLYYFLSS